MPLNLEQKKTIVAEVSDVASKALSAVVAEYCGLTVSQMDGLRQKAREKGVYLRVVPNSLAKRAFQGTDFACLEKILVGPLVLALSKVELGSAARLIKDFVKEHELLKVKALAVGGQLLSEKELDKVASLPTRLEAIAQLASVLKAPITQVVRVINEPVVKFVRTLAAVRDQKQAA